MARIIGLTLPDEKRIVYALTLIHGIGWYRSRKILEKADITDDRRVKDLSEADLKALQDLVEKYKVEGVLKEEVNASIKRLREIGSYKGSRHVKGLPGRGQRTKSNARTKRGKRKTVGALKKEEHARIQQAAVAEARK